MVIVNVIGGLGNQMFQYAFAYVLNKKGFDVKLSTKDYFGYTLHDGFILDKYNISLHVASDVEISKLKPSKLLRKFNFLPFSNSLKEKTLLFNNKYLEPKDGSYIEGYFQSEKYFSEYRDSLLEEFKIDTQLSEYTKELEEMILSCGKTSVSLHIRRGDYVKDSKTNSIHGICELDYYERAIEFLENKYAVVQFFIFSDDIEWVKGNFNKKAFIFVDPKKNKLPHEDIYLMSLCNHNIIANSSFSWWGAWMNQNPDKTIIAPKRWFADENLNNQSKDIVCENWIRI